MYEILIVSLICLGVLQTFEMIIGLWITYFLNKSQATIEVCVSEEDLEFLREAENFVKINNFPQNKIIYKTNN